MTVEFKVERIGTVTHLGKTYPYGLRIKFTHYDEFGRHHSIVRDRVLEMHKWMEETYGNHQQRWYASFWLSRDFYFRDEVDAAAFRLQWG